MASTVFATDDLIRLSQVVETLNWVSALPLDDEVLGLRNMEIILVLQAEIATLRQRLFSDLDYLKRYGSK